MSTNISSLHIFQILRMVTESNEPVAMAEVSRNTGLPSTTVYRALVTLEEAGFLERDRASVRYRPGTTPHFLALTLFNRYRIREDALPLMRKLAAETGETLTLATRLGWYAIRIAAVRGNNDIAYRAAVGAVNLLHRSLQVWTILMHMEDGELESYRRFVRTRYPAHATDIDRSSFTKELRGCRSRGFVTLPAPLGPGFQFAMPIRNPEGKAIATLRIFGGVVGSAEPVIDERIGRWMAMRDELEAGIRADPSRYVLPFSHLDPDTIQLRLTP